MNGHFIHLTVLRITSPCKPASIPCSQCNQRQRCPISASSHASCAQPCCREISFQKLLLLIHLSQMHHREKGFTVLHPSTHQKLISALLQDETLCSHPSTPSTGPLVHLPLHQSYILQVHHRAAQALSAWTRRERGKAGLATLAAKAQTAQCCLSSSTPLSQNQLNTEGSLP